MAGLVEIWSNIEMRSVMRVLQLKGTSPAEIHRQLVQVYGANVMSQKHVCVWSTAFYNGRTDIPDEQRSGRPSTSTTDDNDWTILPTTLTWHRVIFISLDH
jgi:hypothetical protein